jgi:dTDP-4-dehydrorhamnose 3,5-epimerase-like enzyme
MMMNQGLEPYLIDFKISGNTEIGYLAVIENSKNIPFDIKRVFWTYYTPDFVTRGRHAHYKLEQVLVAMTGKITVLNESISGKVTTHVLDSPNVGLYIPPMYWHDMEFSENTVMLSLTSMPYDESDYIREYENFKKYRPL